MAITRFDAEGFGTTYACELPRGDGSNGTFNPDDWMEPKERRKVDDFILYGMAAAEQAVKDAGWQPTDTESLERTGVMIGSGIGGLSSIADTAVLLKERGPRRVSPNASMTAEIPAFAERAIGTPVSIALRRALARCWTKMAKSTGQSGRRYEHQ